MMSPSQAAPAAKPRDIDWGSIWRGYAISLAGTLALGLPLFLLERSVWWVAAAGVLSLFGGGFAAARRARTPEPLTGAFVGVVYFATFAAIIFFGALTESLPDPLPGLPRGDSTFFMAWPLAQVLASTLGAVVGGRSATGIDEGGPDKRRRTGKQPH